MDYQGPMADSDLNELVFRGSGPEECEQFVAAIRQRALAENKHRDDEWIAYLATSYFVGEAFYWFEDLDKETQQDWSRLRPALIARFGRRTASHISSPSTSVSLASVPPATVPTPAAAPPAQITSPSARRGRLKVLDLEGRLRGYLANQTEDGRYNTLTKALNRALLVSLSSPQATEIFEISFVASSQVSTANDTLSIVWGHIRDTRWMRKATYFAECGSSSRIASTTNWVMESNVWKLSADLELSVQYPKPNGSFEPLRPYISPNKAVRWFKHSWIREHGWAQSRLVFEETI